MRKTSKYIPRWVFPLQILPPRLNYHVPTVLLWHKNIKSFHSGYPYFNHPPMRLQIWQTLLPNKAVQVIFCFYIRNWLYYYDIACINYFLDTPRFAVSLVTIISLIYFTYLCDSNDRLLTGKELLYVIDLLLILCKTLTTFEQGTRSLPNPKEAPSLTPSTAIAHDVL